MITQTDFQKLEEIIENQGPEPDEYSFLDDIMAKINVEAPHRVAPQSDTTIDPTSIADLQGKCNFLADPKSIMGHIRLKPYGYAGDYHIIDRIYTNDISSEHPKWDTYALQNTAAQAVRNRKAFLINLLETQCLASPQEKKDKPFHFLNIASGPARDILELYETIPDPDKLKVCCVELDHRAIDFAKKLNQPYEDKICFVNKNVIRFRTEEKFDLVWSAGLFDYFEDRIFVRVLSNMKNWVKPGGEIVIGNFNQDHNPSRNFMEIFGEWYLHHRSPEELTELAIRAGYKKENITVDREPENVNLFLRIRG